jgi:DNA (cytosine-5)-methyltransferase 1
MATRHLETQEDVAYALTNPGDGGRTDSRQVMTPQMQVRRLTPIECERLQGFPDDWTKVPVVKVRHRPTCAMLTSNDFDLPDCDCGAKPRLQPAEDCPDGPRYKAIGNSMATTVINWIGRRIERVLEPPETS